MALTSDKTIDEEDDILGRKEFAAEIYNALILYSRKNTEGITISITGEWGSGKSTMLNFLINELKGGQHKESVKIIEFNPWVFYKEGRIREAFMIQFALALKDFETSRTEIAKKIGAFIHGFRFLKNVSAMAGNVQDGAEQLVEYFAKNDSIAEIKGEIDKALSKTGKKIFVLVDDVDRLTQAEMLELLQVISLVMNFQNVYYIVAFDKDIVISAISKEYGSRAADYLEKIIQVDYSIPVIRKEKLEELFFKMLVDMKQDYNIEFDDQCAKSLWRYHGLSRYIVTVRDLKRFFNSLSFRLPSIADDVNVCDFLAIEAIRIFDNEGYNQFYSMYMSNLRDWDAPESIFKDEQLKQFKLPTRDIIKAIFPNSSLAAIRTDPNKRRIYDSDYFERYFSLLRNDGDIGEKELSAFMGYPEQRSELLKSFAEKGKLKNLLKRLADRRLGYHFSNYDYEIVEAHLNFFSDHRETLESLHHEVTEAIINLISPPKNAMAYIEIFFKSFGNHQSEPNLVFIYFFHFIRMFKRENRSFSNNHYEFNNYYKENYDEIYGMYIGIFKSVSKPLLRKEFTLQCPFIKYLYVINYAEIFPQEYLIYYEELIKDIEFLFYIFSQLIKMDDDLTVHRYHLDYKDVIFPGNLFFAMQGIIKDMDRSLLDVRQKSYLEHFLKIGVQEDQI